MIENRHTRRFRARPRRRRACNQRPQWLEYRQCTAHWRVDKVKQDLVLVDAF